MTKLHKNDSDKEIANKLLTSAGSRWDKLSDNDLAASALMLDAIALESVVELIVDFYGHSEVTDVLSDAVTGMKSESRDKIQ